MLEWVPILIPITINILFVIGFYVLNKKTKFNRFGFMKQQIIIGLCFGASSCFASVFGVDILSTVANVRDAAPLSAGLIFGAPAGIIAGIIGGTFRFFVGGSYTRIACTIATILAGFMAAALRKFMFDDKKPTWSYAIAITILCEVIHMLLILITNMNDSLYAFEFVKGATLVMIIGNVLAVGISLIIVSLISKEGIRIKKSKEHIAETFQRWLLACIGVAFFVTSFFIYFLQDGMASIDTNEIFSSAILDVKTDVSGKSEDYMEEVVFNVKDVYENESKSLSELALEYNVIEINIINEDGIIIDSNDLSIINFDMYTKNQSIEFMDNVKLLDVYVQEYGPIGKDDTTMRKYAGIRLSDGGYLQVGYSKDQYRGILDEFVIDVTKNRHVGSNGFIAVCDEDLKLITQDKDYNGFDVSSIGIIPNEEMQNRVNGSRLYETNIVSLEGGGQEYIYTFIFVEGYCIIAAMPMSEAMIMRDASVYSTLFMQVLIFATLFVFIYFLIKKVIINNLKKVNTTLAEITDGNLNVTVDVRSNEEFASLSDDINLTVATLKRYIKEAAARIDKELEYAKQIQLSALPTNFNIDSSCDVYALMIAAKEVGGDFYDFYKLNDNTIAFLAADVSGKGIPAAMFMMTAKTIIKDLAESGLAVNEIFTRANEKLCENNESGMFVTAWMGILNLNTNVLTYANAGHNPPLLCKENGEFEYLRSRAGFVLAGMEGIRYRVNEIKLDKGDRILLYTDGVTEATDCDNQLYGEERLKEFMNKHSLVNGKDLLPMLKDDIDKFVGDAPQFDDMTMLMFDFKVDGFNKIFDAKLECLDEVLDFVSQTLELYDCPMKLSMGINIAIEEAFVNVCNYAYKDDIGKVILKISFDKDSRDVSFVLADNGVMFNPLLKPDPDISLSVDDREIGGLGIFMVKKTMDDVKYEYFNGQNRLIMIKKI